MKPNDPREPRRMKIRGRHRTPHCILVTLVDRSNPWRWQRKSFKVKPA
jgi:hypothetical protein